VLKITVTETLTERRFVVQGHLVGPWVRELRTAWKRSNQSHNGRTCIVDLSDVTLIDKSGQRLLRALWREGVQLVAKGVYTKGVLAEVESRA
jgi:ABC-type transporter Mla MlaB component